MLRFLEWGLQVYLMVIDYSASHLGHLLKLLAGFLSQFSLSSWFRTNLCKNWQISVIWSLHCSCFSTFRWKTTHPLFVRTIQSQCVDLIANLLFLILTILLQRFFEILVTMEMEEIKILDFSNYERASLQYLINVHTKFQKDINSNWVLIWNAAHPLWA